MRELAPFRFDDYVSSTYGNPFLEQTRITNIDFRWEWFPRFGELVAVSVFYKDLLKPLERIVLDEIGTVPIFSTINGKEARNFGAEFEIRKSLDFIAEPLRNFSINLNLTLVRSNIVPPDELVLYNETIGKQVTAAPPSLRFERPLQGQSDYVLNVALGYQNIENGINVLLLYNIVGRRIIQLSGSQFILDNFYEEPRNQVDLAVSKSFGRNFTIKLIAKNLLDDRFLTTILGRTAERFNTGRVLGLSFTYNL
jgi:outer membrane receptor protein involved in Fe transport